MLHQGLHHSNYFGNSEEPMTPNPGDSTDAIKWGVSPTIHPDDFIFHFL